MRDRITGDEGANAVEFALVLPLLVMLIFGGITAGLALNARQQIDHAGREGVRYAATLQDAPAGSPCDASAPLRDWHQCVRDRVIATSVGSINVSSGGVCVSHIADDGTVTTQYFGTITADDGSTSPTSPCVDESPALSGERVQVKAVAPNRVNAVFVKSPIFNLTTRSIARYEAGD